MTAIDAHGLSVDVPPGWDGRIFRRAEAGELRAADVPGAAAPAGERTFPVVQVATVPIPADSADYGSDIVPALGASDVLVILKEFDPDASAQALFAQQGMPQALDPEDFDPAALQRRLDGQAGRQVFFNESGRAFCLYVVIGSYAARNDVVDAANRVLGSIHIYPASP